jgi:hypothetical protein
VKVFARPIGLHSRAMIRIADAIERHAPDSIEFVGDQSVADLVVFYPIGADWIPLIEGVESSGKKFSLVQCCVKSTGASCATWWPVWQRSACTWSYLDLNLLAFAENAPPMELWDEPEDGDPTAWTAKYGLPGSRFYYAPLGIDDAFLPPTSSTLRLTTRNTVVTTGYVSGRPAEAISEVWEAALACRYQVVHVGGKIKDAWRPGVRVREGISDQELRLIYRSAAYVASLRYVEGFELPALEGLACGATPILFDQPDLRHWYGDSALYVPEAEGYPLEHELIDVFRNGHPERLDPNVLLERFSWPVLVGEFWRRILSNT